MGKPTLITSAANPLIKQVRRAITRGVLTEDGLVAAETFHLLEEALRSALEIRVVIVAERSRSAVESRLGGNAGPRMVAAPDALFRLFGGTETSQGVIALVRLPEWKLDDLFTGTPLVIALDGVQDPGNAGAIVRAAEAFGASGVLFLKGTVSPFNSKTIRASAGSLFRLPFLTGLDAALAAAEFGRRKLRLYTADPRGEMPLQKADLRAPAGIVIGSEARGASEAFRRRSSSLRIPTTGVESLNAALAAAVILFEASRQRSRP